MNRLRLLLGKVTKKMGVPDEVSVGTSRITLTGNYRLILENHKGLIEYSTETVRIKTLDGTVRIEGNELLLDVMDSSTVAISGNVYCIFKFFGYDILVAAFKNFHVVHLIYSPSFQPFATGYKIKSF